MSAWKQAAGWLPFLFGAMLLPWAVDARAQTTGLPAPMAGDCSTSSAGQVACTRVGGITPPNKRVYTFAALGTSFVAGTGASNYNVTSAAALLAKQTKPLRTLNLAVPGSGIAQISLTAFQGIYSMPGWTGAYFVDAGPNDGAINQTQYANALSAMLAWLSIPNYSADGSQHRFFPSAGSGWSPDTTIVPAVAPGVTSPGGMVGTSTAGSTLTFSIPPSATPTKLGFTWLVSNSGTGTFTVSVDGSAQTAGCSGNTSFSSVPCGGSVGYLPYILQRQEFAVAAGAHTVTVTTTNGGAVSVLGVDTLPPAGDAGTGGVFLMNANAYYTNYAQNNATLAGVVAAMGAAGDGLPIFPVDQVNGLGSTPGVNATSDLSTSATALCPASTQSGHPNDCGYRKMANLVNAVEQANGWVFSDPLSQGTNTLISPLFAVGGTTRDDFYTYVTGAMPAGLGSGGNTGGIDTLRYSALRFGFGAAFGQSGSGVAGVTAHNYALQSNGFPFCVDLFDNSTDATIANHITPKWCGFPDGTSVQVGKQTVTTSGPGYNAALYTPVSSSAACTVGDFADDANFHYVCTSANTWKRVALSAF